MVNRAIWCAGVTVLLLACSDSSEPDTDPFPGRWLLVTVNGQPLPAQGTSPAMEGTVTGGRLTLRAPGSGLSRWEWCNGLARNQPVTYGANRSDLATVRYDFPLSSPIDTLRLAGGVLTYEHNRDAGPTDLLRFTRLEDGEGNGSPCAL